jgi:hypothetical protein
MVHSMVGYGPRSTAPTSASSSAWFRSQGHLPLLLSQGWASAARSRSPPTQRSRKAHARGTRAGISSRVPSRPACSRSPRSTLSGQAAAPGPRARRRRSRGVVKCREAASRAKPLRARARQPRARTPVPAGRSGDGARKRRPGHRAAAARRRRQQPRRARRTGRLGGGGEGLQGAAPPPGSTCRPRLLAAPVARGADADELRAAVSHDHECSGAHQLAAASQRLSTRADAQELAAA